MSVGLVLVSVSVTETKQIYLSIITPLLEIFAFLQETTILDTFLAPLLDKSG